MANFIANIPYSDPAGIKRFITERPENERIVRQEFTKVRDIVRKRINRLNTADYSTPRMPRQLRDLDNYGIAEELARMYQFVNSKESTVRGKQEIDRRRLDSLKKMGIELTGREQLKLFGDFMDTMRSKALGRAFSSGRAAGNYEGYVDRSIETAQRLGINLRSVISNYKQFAESYNRLAHMKRKTPEGAEITWTEFRQKYLSTPPKRSPGNKSRK